MVIATGRPLHPDLTEIWNWPHTITLFAASRQRYNSYLELPETPPEEHWDYPRLIRQHIERLYPGAGDKTSANVDVQEVEG